MYLLLKDREKQYFEDTAFTKYFFNGDFSKTNMDIFRAIFKIRPEKEIVVCGLNNFHTNVIECLRFFNSLCLCNSKISFYENLKLRTPLHAGIVRNILKMFAQIALISAGIILLVNINIKTIVLLLFVEFFLQMVIEILPSEAKIHKYLDIKKVLFPVTRQAPLYFLKGHPFCQYTGNNQRSGMNRFGYYDKEFTYQEKECKTRIMCMGDSVSAGNGAWPALMENYLNNESENYVVNNFSLGGYTTAHSLSVFALNGIDFKPDIIIVHHLITDALCSLREDFKNDYSHYFKNWELDHHTLGLTNLEVFFLTNSYLFFIISLLFTRYISLYKKDDVFVHYRNHYPNESFTKELIHDVETKCKYVFLRNIKNIICMAQKENIKVIITTVQLCDSKYDSYFTSVYSKYNDFICDLAVSITNIHFLDLDKMFKQYADVKHLFIDSHHMTNKGNQKKAELIGKYILSEIQGVQNLH